MIDPDRDLYPHQLEALRKLGNGKTLYGGVGTGKSRVAAAYYKQNEAPKDVYVITTAKKRDSWDWQEEFYRIGIGPRSGPAEVGLPKNGRSKARRPRSELGRDHVREAQHASADVFISSPEPRNEGMDLSPTERGPTTPERVLGKADRRRLDGVSDVDRPSDELRDGLGKDFGELSARNGGLPSASSRSGFHETAGVYPWVLTVDSWNNINKYAGVEGAFFAFDEQRLVGSGLWTKAFLRISRRNTWILLTGTPGDTWMDYIPIFVANNFYKNRTEFKREHVVYNTFTKFPKVDRYINVGRLVRQREQLLVKMPYERHTKRRHVEVPLPYDKELLDRVLTKRWHVYEDRPLLDVAEMFHVMRKVVNSDPSRLEMVKELWKNHPKLIVFYNFNYELESLRSLSSFCGVDSSSSSRSSSGSNQPESGTTKDGLRPISERLSSKTLSTKSSSDNASRGKLLSGAPSTIAEWNGHKHQPIPTTDRWLYLVQYTAGAEGWNCVETDAMVMYSKNYSWKVTEQAEGRIDRLNTPFTDLWYYQFTSDSMIDKAISRSLKAKETFNVAKFSRLFAR